MMNAQKLLFADLYRLINSIRAELKVLAKQTDELLFQQADWDSTSLLVNGIVSEGDIVRRMSEAAMVCGNEFLEHGPYPGEHAGVTPLEAIAGVRGPIS